MTTTKIILYVLTCLAAYLVGSINFAILFTYLGNKKDIKSIGSGNPGTMNVLRSVGKLYGALTFICDALKGLAFTLIGRFCFTEFGPTLMFVLGFITIIGHIFPIYTKFKGGKGVATTIGVFLAIYPIITAIVLTALILWIFFGKYGFIGSLVSIAILDAVAIGFNYTNPTVIVLSIINLLLIIFTHRGNIKRLKNGKENTLQLAKKDKTPPSENQNEK